MHHLDDKGEVEGGIRVKKKRKKAVTRLRHKISARKTVVDPVERAKRIGNAYDVLLQQPKQSGDKVK